MAEHAALPHFREVMLFLALSGLLIPLLAKFRVNQVLGFLAAGMLVGPFGAGNLDDVWPWMEWFTFQRPEAVASLAELGIIFLMFTIGLELSIQRLIALRKWVFGVGVAQMVLTGLIVAGIEAWMYGVRFSSALVQGFVLAFSSTAVVMQLLRQRHELASPMGRGVFSVLLLQDLAVVPMLLLVGMLGLQNHDTSQPIWVVLSLVTIKSVASVGLIYVIARKILRPIFYHLNADGSAETFFALVLLATLGIAAATWAIGLSMAMGALLAGLLLAETEFRHRVALMIEPFTGLLMGLFFLSVGMSIDVSFLMAEPLKMLGLAIGLMALKSLIAGLVLRAGGLPWPCAAEGGVLLGQGGEFAFVVVSVSIASGFVGGSDGQVLLLIVGMSMFLTPLSAKLGTGLSRLIERRYPKHGLGEPDAAEINIMNHHVIVVGYGRVGQEVVAALDSQNVPTIVVDSDPSAVKLGAGKLPIFVGNVSQHELLHKLAPERAQAVVLTINDPASSLGAVRAIREHYHKLPIIARAHDERHALALSKVGATHVVPETMEASLQLSGMALESIGIPEEAVHELVNTRRESIQSIFRGQTPQ